MNVRRGEPGHSARRAISQHVAAVGVCPTGTQPLLHRTLYSAAVSLPFPASYPVCLYVYSTSRNAFKIYTLCATGVWSSLPCRY